MAAFQGSLVTAEVALAAATAKTVIQIVAPSNHRVKILRWGVFFDGVSGTGEPVQIALHRQSTEGTSSALTPYKLDDSLAESLQTAGRHTATAEPTTGDLIDAIEVHPQSGYEMVFPLGQEIIVGGGDRVGIICTAPAIVNVRAKIVFEE